MSHNYSDIIARSENLERRIFKNQEDPEIYKSEILDLLNDMTAEPISDLSKANVLGEIFFKWKELLRYRLMYLYAKSIVFSTT